MRLAKESARMVVCLGWLLAVPFSTAQGNKITLSVDPTSARVKQKITLLATVTNNGNAASGGTVTFYDGKSPMSDIQVVGTHPAKGHQEGTAVLTTILAPGSHLLTAVYGGTKQWPGRVRSSTKTVTVTGQTVSETLLTARPNAQNPQNYDFTATVGGAGFAVPTGNVDFADITTGTDLGNSTLSSLTQHGLTPGLLIPSAGQPAQSVVADFNGDGLPDVATVNASFGPSTMSVYLGEGNGEFQTAVSYPTGVFTSGILAADFNQDGIPDIAAMSQGDSGADGDVAIFLGNGDGSFRGPVDNVLGTFPVAIAIGDFNRDGILDFVTIDYFVNVADVSLGNGDGTFQPPVAYPVGSGPYSVTTGDFNNDGIMDIAAVNDNVNTMSVLLGNSDGTFQPQVVYHTGSQVEFVTAGDLNHDGNQDLIVANYAEPSVGVFLGKGDGTFQAQVTYAVNGPDSGLSIADMDGDGVPDIVVSYYQPAKIGILRGKGDGTFGTVRDFPTGQPQGYESSVADLNGDGTPDVVSDDINSSISILLNGTVVSATLSNVAVPGTPQDQEKIVASYGGDMRYKKSQSKVVVVKGSGAK